MAGGLALLVVGLALGEASHFQVSAVSERSAWAFVYLVFVGALIGFTAYLWLIRNVTPALATTYAFVNPIVAVALGAWIASEPPTPRTAVAAAVVIAAVAIITQGKSMASKRGALVKPPVPSTQESPGGSTPENRV